jgi:putative ABC transport system permease protein
LHLTVREEKGEPSFAYVAIARLKPRVTPEQAQAEVQTTIPTFTYENNEKIDMHARVELLHTTLAGPARQGLFVLLGAVGFVLLIVCVNVANLLLVRAAGRQRELAIRAALGASRWHLLADSLSESFCYQQ